MNITLVETRQGDEKPTLFRGTKYPGAGPARIASVLYSRGHDVKFVSEYLTGLNEREIRRIADSDAVGFKTLSASAKRAYEIADLVRRYNPEAVRVFGGPHATFSQDEALEHGEYVIGGAAEYSFLQLIESLSQGGSIDRIPGLSTKVNGKSIRNKIMPMTLRELESLPPINWGLVDGIKKGLTLPLSTALGCNFACDFCEVVRMFGRPRIEMGLERALLEFENLASYKPNVAMLTDDSVGQPTRENPRSENTKKLYRTLEKRGIVIPQIAQMNVRTAASDPELLKILGGGGVFLVLLGIEPKNKKNLDRQETEKALDNLEKAGIFSHGMTVYGLNGSDREDLNELADYFRNSRLSTAQATLLAPFRGSRLYEELEREGRIFDHNTDSWDTGRVTTFHDTISPSEVQEACDQLFEGFYTGRSLSRRLGNNRKRFLAELPKKVFEGLKILVRSSKRVGLETAAKMAVNNAMPPLIINFFLRRGRAILEDWKRWEEESGYLDYLREKDKDWERLTL